MSPARLPADDRLDPSMIAVLRSKAPAEKLEMVDGFWRSPRELIRSLGQHEHPDWSSDQIMREVAKRLSHGAV